MLADTTDDSILIIEDDRIDVLNIMRSFKRHDISNVVHLAEDGVAAFNLLLNTQWDAQNPCPSIVILDINMPRMNGFEFLDKLKHYPQLDFLNIFILTNSSDLIDIKRAHQYNIRGYVVKPFSHDKLDQILVDIHRYWSISERPPIVIDNKSEVINMDQSPPKTNGPTLHPDIGFLVIEDDHVDQIYLKRCFKQLGLKNMLYVAKDGVEALAILRHSGWTTYNPRPQVILLDLNMPLMNGHEFLHAIRNDDELKDIHVFVTSTSNDNTDVTSSLEFDVSGYFTKPINVHHLIMALNELNLSP